MGKPRNTRKYPTYPEIPEIPGNTRKKKRYPEIPDRIFRHSYPTRTRPATRYFVQYPTRSDIEKPYPLGTDCHLLTVPNPIIGLLCCPHSPSDIVLQSTRFGKNGGKVRGKNKKRAQKPATSWHLWADQWFQRCRQACMAGLSPVQDIMYLCLTITSSWTFF